VLIVNDGASLTFSCRYAIPYTFAHSARSGQIYRPYQRFSALDGRRLTELRQVRALAGLDTSEMDLAITERVLQSPILWGSLGAFLIQVLNECDASVFQIRRG
jgi:hypothetical protein